MSPSTAAGRRERGLLAPLLGLPLLALGLAGALLVEEGNRAVGSIGGQGYDVLWMAAWLGFPVVGAVILRRRGHHPIGWIMYVVGVSLTAGLLSNAIAVRHGFVAPVPVVGPVATWLSFWIILPAFGLPAIFLLLFPSGRVGGRWRRRLLRALVTALCLNGLVHAARPTHPLDGHGLTGEVAVNPLGVESLGWLLDPAVEALSVTMVALTLLAIGDAVRRMVRGEEIERRQLRWVAIAVVPFPVLMTAAGLVAGGRYNDLLVALAFFVSLQGLVLAVLIAITRYRLYEIDRIVSRTVAYAIVTGVLLAVYAGTVLLLGRVLAPVTQQSEIAVAASTLLVAALFQPLRRRVQSGVDRRFNRARYDAQRTVADFAARLRDAVDLDELRGELGRAAGTTLQPAHVSLWLKEAR